MIMLLPSFEIRMGTWGEQRGVDQSGLKMLHDMVMVDGNATRSFTQALQVPPGHIRSDQIKIRLVAQP